MKDAKLTEELDSYREKANAIHRYLTEMPARVTSEEFVVGQASHAQKCYMGVDPGIKGGVALVSLSGDALLYEMMPAGPARLAALIKGWLLIHPNIIMIIERAQPMPKQGVSSSFNYGRHFGAFEAIAVVLGVPYHEVSSSVWKKAMQLSSNKADSVRAAMRIWPTANLRPGMCRKDQDGLAEALLLAEWGRRQNL